MTSTTTSIRFQPGDAVIHNGRPATIGGHKVTAEGSVRYHIFYTDDQGGVAFDLFGRVLSRVR